MAASGCDPTAENATESLVTTLPPPKFVGGEACVTCHAEQAARWRGSHHDKALQPASLGIVLGDFDDAEFTYNDVTSSFFVRNGEPWVRTDGPDGVLQDFKVTHAIGVEPLQQYLIEFPNGHFQVLSVAWDARSADQGGQRWYHLYPDDAIGAGDPLHWTGTFQSWNAMCAECHSTDLTKNYVPEDDRFETSWTDINVDCEACHGPGSNHAADPSVAPPALTSVERAWVFAEGARIAALAEGSERSNEIEVCAQCHSRRSQLTDDHEPDQPFLDAFRPALLDAGLYHADGQIADEVYVYGSFLQSAMAAAGVTCSDCHEPHSAELRAEANAVCGRCHLASAFGTPEHHKHAASNDSVECVDCHMRTETYMGVDPRRDHSFRVPRPDLSGLLGSPNACNDCHDDQTAEWAAAQIAAWFPDGRHNEFHYGEALHAGRTWAANSRALLRRVIEDESQSAIVRATATSLIANQLDAATIDLITAALNDSEPLVQLAAIDATQTLPADLRVDYAQRFLTSPLKSLRTAAARSLLTAREQLSQSRQRDLDQALGEYLEVQRFNSDRGEGLLNAGVIATELGQFEVAERTYRESLEREPAFSASYVNLADLYRAMGREQDAEEVLEAGLAVNPDDAAISFALGLSLVRSGRLDDALIRLSRAVAGAPESPYYAYVQGIALNSTGDREAALRLLRSSHERFPAYRETLLGLATILRDADETEEALEYARRLVVLAPADPTARGLVAELEASSRN